MTEPPRKRDYPGQWNYGRGDWKCDFCLHKNAPEMWFYPHKPFDFYFDPLAKQIVYKDNALAACERCRKLIEADKYAELVNASTETAKVVMGMVPPFMQDLLTRAYNLFRANRTTVEPIHIRKQSGL
jgi:hypothetical protein